VVERLKRERGAQVDWRPFYLRPDTPAEGLEMPEDVRMRMAGTQEKLRQMALASGLSIVFPARIPNTRRAHEATEWARGQNKLEEFHRIVFHKYFGLGEDISRWAVLESAAEEAGLEAAEMRRRVESGEFRGAVEQQIAQAQALEIEAVPTYILNGRLAVVGAQPYEVFQRGLDRLEAEQKGGT
jgi:predicted DsbA family dithiol-disulfide isomerase